MTLTWLTDPDIWLSLLTLTLLEIVLGVDNLIFLSLISAKLPARQRPKVRRLGLGAALVMRVLLLCTLVHLARMVEPVLSLGAHFSFSWRDLILLGGGLFLMYKAVREIHHDVDALEGDSSPSARPGFWAAVAQIMLLDLVFSIDSIITAVGLANDLPVMIAAIVIAMAVMLWAAKWVSDFIEQNPTIKMLVLAFLLLVGLTLVADGMHFHIPRGYLYFAIAFSMGVEGLNILTRKKRGRKKA